ncbi:MAG: CatB-related O-acetyltransferase [Neisseriaceae bacterium]|nr:CatB-related O-acetyltransferase [Neisseriaceae bacterium]
MTKYKFIMTEEICLILEQEGLLFCRGLECDSGKTHLMGKWVFFSELSSFYNTAYRVGDRVYPMGAYSYSSTNLPLEIKVGNYCSIAGGIKMRGWEHPITAFTTNHIAYDAITRNLMHTKLVKNSTNLKPKRPKFHMGNDVWIANNVLLPKHITIGTGAIIAACANVTKDVPPYAIVGGNPARILKYRFEEKIIEQLLETCWTEYDIAPMEICGDIPIENFIEEFYNYRDKGLIKPIVLKNLKEVLDKNGIEYSPA